METLRTAIAHRSRSRSPLLPRCLTGGDLKMNPARPTFLSGRENIPLVHPNIQIDHPSLPLVSKKTPSPVALPAMEILRSEADDSLDSSDPSVKVVVRMRPANRHERGEERIIQKVSSDSLSVGGRTFTFDSVLDSMSTQEEVFNLVGVPLVKNSLAGFNTSVVCYGQTGSGKTYTMWGPPSAMVDGHSINSYQGIVPRVFQMLFSEINRRQENSEEQQTNYQCRCSFLEVYNDQINDLLDPTQRNLQIRDDSANGFHVENLTDEYVTAVEEVTQLLVKGLSNRKVGTTSIHSKSSRSHIVFTCIVESWCKGSSSKCFGSSKTSRISLVDLAGSDTDKPDDVSRLCVKENRHVKKSLRKLGKLVNILTEEGPHMGEDEKTPPYMDSCLTHLLHETLGGNAKVTFICAIFPNDRYRAGTLSTLRFGERARCIENKAVINEITEDDVNGLSDQIRQLKEELIRAKSFGAGESTGGGGYFKGRNARDSLNLLRMSLNRSLILPHMIDNDDSEDEEMMEVDEDDVRELCVQLTNIAPSSQDNSEDVVVEKKHLNYACLSLSRGDDGIESDFGSCCSQELSGGDGSVQEETRAGVEHSEASKPICSDHSNSGNDGEPNTDSFSKSPRLSIIRSSIPDDPTLCESPKISSNSNKLRKSIIMGSSALDKYESDDIRCHIRSSLQSSKVCPTESLAASLHKGLQIIDYHQQNPAVKKSFIGLSFEHLASLSLHRKVDAGMQTLPEEEDVASSTPSLLRSFCRKKVDSSQHSEMQIVLANEAGTPEILKKQVFKADQFNHELEQGSLAHQKRQHAEFLCLVGGSSIKESSLDTSERKAHLEEIESLRNQLKVYTHAEDSPLKMIRNGEVDKKEEDIEKERQRWTESERKSLLEEIESLRNQLKVYTHAEDSPLEMIRNGGVDKKEEDIEKERQRWTESESRWISLAEELRLDLESNRKLAEKKQVELEMENKCRAELEDALTRSILGHTRMVEHYADLQEKHEGLLWSHRKVMEGISEVKKAAAKAGGKRAGSAFVSALAAELSTLRIEREKERAYLKEQNKGLKIQLRDTAEAVHAAGELLVRLREAEEAVSVTEEKYGRAQQEAEKLRKQMEKMKKKHAMDMVTMKHYIAESRLPESALEPFYLNDTGRRRIAQEDNNTWPLPNGDDDQSWRAAFGPSYRQQT